MERSIKMVWLFLVLAMLAAWIGLSEEVWRYFILRHTLRVVQALDPDKIPPPLSFFGDVPMDDVHRKLLAALLASPDRDAVTFYRGFANHIHDDLLESERQMLIWLCTILALLSITVRLFFLRVGFHRAQRLL